MMSTRLMLKITAQIVAVMLSAGNLLSSFVILNIWEPPNAARTSPGPITLEDYSDIVTQNDLGFSDFSGNSGVINDQYGGASLHCTDPQTCMLRFDWDFGSELEVFTGLFNSLFGLTDT